MKMRDVINAARRDPGRVSRIGNPTHRASVLPCDFVPVPGLGGYAVSRDGRVFSRYTGSFRKGQINAQGYVKINAIDDSGVERGVFVHRMVAIAYIPNPSNRPSVNHKNGKHADNRVENLEWVTASENTIHALRTGLKKPLRGEDHWKARLTWNDVQKIRKMHAEGVSAQDINRSYPCVGRHQIYSIVSGKSWTGEHTKRISA